jgi:predicted HTH transcriptional regulator
MKSKVHPIKRLINQGEHQQLDFKYEISDAARIARSLAAFANTDGGKLLIGVKDNGVIRGIRSDEELYMLENAAQNYCQPEVKFTTKEWEIDDKVVLEADIPYSKKHIHKAPDNDGEYKAYVRVDDQNLLANGVLLKVWQKKKKNQKIKFVYTKPVQEVLFYLREHPFISLEQAREASGLNKFKTEHLLSDLVLLEVIEQYVTEDAEIYRLRNDIPEFE